MIDVDVAQTFLKVAEASSFQLAAKELNVTQSTVSARIKTLEERLGLKVFDRTRSGAVLNKHGRAFQRYAAAIVQAWEEGRTAVSGDRDDADRLSVGGEHNLWTRLLALWLLELRSKHPASEIVAEANDGDVLIEKILDGRLDLGVVHTAPVHPALDIQRLMDDELVLVTTDATGLFEDRYVDIRWPMSEFAQAQKDQVVCRGRITLDLGFPSVNYLMMSQGAGYLPMRLVDPFLQAGLLFLAPDAPRFHSSIYIVSRIGSATPVSALAVSMLQDLAVLAAKGELPPPFWSRMI